MSPILKNELLALDAQDFQEDLLLKSIHIKR